MFQAGYSWLLDCPVQTIQLDIHARWKRDPLQNVIVKSVGHSSVCGVSGGGEIPTPKKNQPQQKPEGMSHSHPFHHASKTGFSDLGLQVQKFTARLS